MARRRESIDRHRARARRDHGVPDEIAGATSGRTAGSEHSRARPIPAHDEPSRRTRESSRHSSMLNPAAGSPSVDLLLAGLASPRASIARRMTASNIGRRQPAGERVLLARVVACRGACTARSAPPRRARTAAAAATACPAAANARSAASQPNAPERDDHPHRRRAAPARGRGTARRCRAPRSSACWPAARSGPRPRCTRRSASARRRRGGSTGRSASPASMQRRPQEVARSRRR